MWWPYWNWKQLWQPSLVIRQPSYFICDRLLADAELIKAYGLRRPRRRRGCRAGRRAKPRPPAATSALDQSANYLAAAASRPCSSTISSATTTTTITTDDSAQSSVNNQLIAKQSVNTLPSILGKDCTIWTPTKTYEIGQNRVKLAE